MKTFAKILAILLLLLVIGIASLVAIGLYFQRHQEELFGGGWHVPHQVAQNPKVPSVPTYEDRKNRSAKPTFSVPHGYYEDTVLLSLRSNDPEAVVWFTTNGSIPLSSEDEGGPNGQRFEKAIPIDRTSRITAVAYSPGQLASIPVTQTYLFLDEILQQNRARAITDGWPDQAVNGKRLDYGMDPEIIRAFTLEEWREAFQQIATISLVTPQGHLTDPSYGIYTNPMGHGKGWERYTSVELINPAGSGGFQAGAGLRIRGGFTRNPYSKKHGFRLFFRRIYGTGKLNYPLFGDEGADRFDKVDLRTAQNYSWARESNPFHGTHNTFVREVFCRDTQRDLGSPYTRSRYYHLFLNGHYWGIYMMEERPEAAYGATYFQGNREDFDTLKCSNFIDGYQLEATDGNTDVWRELWEKARALAENPTDETYASLVGLSPDLRRTSGLPALVDVDNLINYMLIHFYAGNSDGPLSAFLGNERSNNWFALRNRNGQAGFRFFVHDAEHTLGTPDSQNDRTGPFHSRNQNRFRYSNPQWLHQDLMSHPRYREHFATLARQHLTGDGALTTAPCIARFQARVSQIDKAIRAQSARWGDAVRRGRPYTVADWESRVEWVVNHVLRNRELAVVEQLKADGLYPPASD
ncbi:MAG: hypothetical protein M2R45_03035 [Verrucomicrobia subdivision 3 bacterium]|nr:hypothetical protein [Limisphaerales bacterium]MCS1415555.1 hypothetical protein [Limisphaerales bacterium]